MTRADAPLWMMIAIGVIAGLVFLSDVILAALWAYSASRARRGLPPLFAPRWSVLHVWFAGQVVVVLTIVATVIWMTFWMVVSMGSRFLAEPHPFGPPIPDMEDLALPVILPSAVLQNLFTVGVVLLVVGTFYKVPLRAFLLGHRPLRGIRIGLLVGIPTVAGTLLIEAGLERLARFAGRNPIIRILEEIQKQMGISEIILKLLETPLGFAMTLLVIGIIAPIGEEIFFRGFAFNALRKRFGVPAGIILSALLFSAIHVQPLSLVPMIFISIVLAYTYYRTGTLLAPITIHALNNCLVVVLVYFFPSLAT